MSNSERNILTIGAYERDNFGDLLFYYVLNGHLREHYSLTAGSTMDTRVKGLLGVPVVAYPSHVDDERWSAVWVVGGEIGGVTTDTAMLMNLGVGEQNKKKRQLAEEKLADIATIAYLPNTEHIAKKSKLIVNSVGLTGLAKVEEHIRDRAVRSLRDAAYVSVRDVKSFMMLTELGIEASLAPDLVHTIIDIMQKPVKPEGLPEKYLLVQMSQDIIDETGIDVIGRAIDELHQVSGIPTVFFLAGTAQGHDSEGLYRKIMARMESQAQIYSERRPEVLAAAIRHADVWVGSSLHGRIIASSYGVRRISIDKDKVNEYASCWDKIQPYGVKISALSQAYADATKLSNATLHSQARRLSGLARDNLYRIRRDVLGDASREVTQVSRGTAGKNRGQKRHIECRVYVDEPKKKVCYEPTVTFRGWILPAYGGQLREVKLRVNGVYVDIDSKIERQGVLRTFPEQGRQALFSGFSAELKLALDGVTTVELIAVTTEGVETVAHSLQYEYHDEKTYVDYLSNYNEKNAAEQATLMDAKSAYYYEAEKNQNLSSVPSLTAAGPRLVAFYLPQFHPFEINDTFWGKGFTEWTNVTAAKSRFVGHEQPKLPGALGYYDLRLDESMEEQIDLAKRYGLHGFCFYYYWFSGERVMEKPLDNFLKHSEWDFNFMICWANENWTKRWDGLDSEVIISQRYLEDDALRFIKDVEPILLDVRYIKNNGKPLLAVYRGDDLKAPEKSIRVWRDYFREKHDMELEIVTMLSFNQEDPRTRGFDGGIEFEPMTTTKHMVAQQVPMRKNQYSNLIDKPLDEFSGVKIQFANIVEASLHRYYDRFDFPRYKSVTPSWDNDARKKGAGTVFFGSNPRLYSAWLDTVLSRETTSQQSPLIFLNAWNEWAEGAVLEPSRFYGHAYLNRTSEVLAKYTKSLGGVWKPEYAPSSRDTKLAVIVHAYYIDGLEDIRNSLTNIEAKYDLFITTRPVHLDHVTKMFPSANVRVVPNRGRDILPFIYTARRLYESGYETFLKLHTKKSVHRLAEDGHDWFGDMLSQLLPSRRVTAKVINYLGSNRAGLIGPHNHFISYEQFMGSNAQTIVKLANDIGYNSHALQPVVRGYFAGSMFWGRFDAISPLLRSFVDVEDFDSEKGQVDGTLAHAIERSIPLIVASTRKAAIYAVGNDLTNIDQLTPLSRYEFAKAKNEKRLQSDRSDLAGEDVRSLKNSLDDIKKSKSYRIGKAITSPARYLHKLKHRLQGR